MRELGIVQCEGIVIGPAPVIAGRDPLADKLAAADNDAERALVHEEMAKRALERVKQEQAEELELLLASSESPLRPEALERFS